MACFSDSGAALVQRSLTSAAVVDAIREAANSIANGIPSKRRQERGARVPRILVEQGACMASR
jgi:hypothetical protein